MELGDFTARVDTLAESLNADHALRAQLVEMLVPRDLLGMSGSQDWSDWQQWQQFTQWFN